MNTPRIEDLAPDEFEALMERMLSEEYDQVTSTQLFGALAAQDTSEAEVIELTAHVENGQLVLEQPAPLRVKGSEINIYDKRIVIKLREPAAA